MFMFWGKRTSYTKRLLKAKVRGEHETECEAQENHHIVRNTNSPESSSSSSPRSNTNTNRKKNKNSNNHHNNNSLLSNTTSTSTNSIVNNGCCYASSSVAKDEDNKIYGDKRRSSSSSSSSSGNGNRTARCKEFLKSLKENQLEMLLAAVESYGANLGACVMVKRRRRGSDVGVDIVDEVDVDCKIEEGEDEEDEESADEMRRRRRRRRRNNGEESLQMTSTTERTTSNSDTSGGNNTSQIDRNSMNYCPHRNHNNHHHHNHNHNNNNHNRQRQRQVVNVNDNNISSNDKLLFKERDDRDYEENILLGERITAAATTTTTTTNTTSNTTTRRSRTSGNNTELPVDPHLLCCQIWRWPDLTNSSELKRLPVCHSSKDPVDICCNPYHWSRLCKPESPPPPYCLIADRLRPEDRAPSEGDDVRHRYRNTNSPPLPGSLTTNGEDLSGQREWCTLAYWELGGRVGRLYPVEPSTVNVFDSILDGDGLCLANLAENHSTSPAIQRTRSKIGLGLMLSQESDGVWAYNRSDNPIFVNSPTLDDPESRTLLVYRVPPGFCLNIFDRAKKLQQTYVTSSTNCQSIAGGQTTFSSGPVDVNSVRISFAKGWGPKYSRQEVTSCPCWLEVLLAPCR